MREFVIVYMLEPVSIGTRFTMWPLHLTLLPWFEAPDVKTIVRDVSQKLAGTAAFDVTVGERATLGHKHLPVMLITLSPSLQMLHQKLLEVIDENNWKLQGRHTGAGFTPHVTQKGGRDASGTLHIDRLYIAEAQAQGYREIVGKVELAA